MRRVSGGAKLTRRQRATFSKLNDHGHQQKLVDIERERMEPISVVILIRTDTTLDHSQKAEKVWPTSPGHRRSLLENNNTGGAAEADAP